MSKTKTLELAMEKAAALPDAAQEQIGREMLEHIQALADLRAQLEIGLQQLDAGRGRGTRYGRRYQGSAHGTCEIAGGLFGRQRRRKTWSKSGNISRVWPRPKLPTTCCVKLISRPIGSKTIHCNGDCEWTSCRDS